jgi:hypothetical protein
MKDLLVRLRNALPQMRQWIDDLHANHSGESVRASELGFSGLAAHLPRALLQNVSAVMTYTIPFPPARKFGLPEFTTMETMPMDGITFGNMYFVRPAAYVEAIHFHELVHVIQWNTLGFEQFLMTYGFGIIQCGYERSPLEAMAYELQARLQHGHQLRNVVETVERHATSTRDAAAVVFAQNGIEMTA